jgi:NTP pyrophosphatase (non-canonical NTP hydrolase)
MADPLTDVLRLKKKYQLQWRDKPDDYWLARLMQEVGELASALADDHDDTPEHELAQIASICLNWLDKREEDGYQPG